MIVTVRGSARVGIFSTSTSTYPRYPATCRIPRVDLYPPWTLIMGLEKISVEDGLLQ